MDEPWGHYAKWYKLVTKGQTVHDSTYYGVSKTVKFIEQKAE